MNSEQIYELLVGLKQTNGTLIRMADYFEGIDDKICETNDKVEETNEHLDYIGDSIVNIEGSLSKIAEQLERIANIFEMKETRSFTLNVENCFDPSNDLFASQEPESVDEKEKEHE